MYPRRVRRMQANQPYFLRARPPYFSRTGLTGHLKTPLWRREGQELYLVQQGGIRRDNRRVPVHSVALLWRNGQLNFLVDRHLRGERSRRARDSSMPP